MAREVKIPVPGRCVAGVWDMGRRYQCWHRGRYADDGSPGDRWCGTHCPAKVALRRRAAVIAWSPGPPTTPGWYLLAHGQSLAGTPLVTFGTVTARDLPNLGDVLWHLRLPEIPA